MTSLLTEKQTGDRAQFRAFVDEIVAPAAARIDREGTTPAAIVRAVAARGFLGATIPAAFGGAGMDAVTFGLLTEEIGRGCSSVRSLLTVNNMVAHALHRWGTAEQRKAWLPRLATGEVVAALALTEPGIGSDAAGVESTATALANGGYRLDAHKRWITYGALADVLLVFAKLDGKPSAFLVPTRTDGCAITKMEGALGVRGSMLADIQLRACEVPASSLVCRPGLGVSHVASTALDHGRYSVAWGCVGIAQASLEASRRYAHERRQFGVLLEEHQLVRRMLTDMLVSTKAARLLCLSAGRLRDAGDPDGLVETSMAKYYASTVAMKAALDAVQIHGANGCGPDFPVERYLRDAKIMEIIEGTSQIHQSTLATAVSFSE